jgi:tetratricopeptide (TPR) repeat protein
MGVINGNTVLDGLDEMFKKVFILAKQKQFHEAIDLLLEPDKNHLRKPFYDDANHAWYIVGDLYWHCREYMSSLEAFRNSLKMRPDDVEAVWAIGNCYDKLKDPEMAEYFFRKALRLAPANYSIRFNLGNSLFDQGKFSEALREYKKIASCTDPDIAKSVQKNILLASKRKLSRMK